MGKLWGSFLKSPSDDHKRFPLEKRFCPSDAFAPIDWRVRRFRKSVRNDDAYARRFATELMKVKHIHEPTLRHLTVSFEPYPDGLGVEVGVDVARAVRVLENHRPRPVVQGHAAGFEHRGDSRGRVDGR